MARTTSSQRKRKNMQPPVAQQIFVNLPVKDLDRTVAFFARLGFTFDPQFTDKNAACMRIGKEIYAMLLVERFFKTFTKKIVVDAKKGTEVILALSVESRKRVDEIVAKALKAGGKEPRKAQDHGWMYGRSFQDLDGHIWEVFFMDVRAMKRQ